MTRIQKSSRTGDLDPFSRRKPPNAQSCKTELPPEISGDFLYLCVRVRVIARVRGEPLDYPLHLQHTEYARPVAALVVLPVGRIPGRVPAKRHQNHRDHGAFPPPLPLPWVLPPLFQLEMWRR